MNAACMRVSRRSRLRGLAGLCALAAAARAAAFGIAPIPEEQVGRADNLIARVQRAVGQAEARTANWFRERFRASVHEEITHAAYGCTASPSDCDRAVAAGSPDGAPLSVIQGVEWNDNPPFRLRSARGLRPTCIGNLIQLPNAFPECWGAIFGLGAQTSAFLPATRVAYGPGSLILLRSHFGDLQFLHAMATREGETAQETHDQVMTWAAFAYGVAHGDIAPATILSSPQAGVAARLFPGSGMDVRSLFTQGTEHGTQRVRDMAFGSLLHVVEDSFSAAHVDREPPGQVNGAWMPGCIREFHSYAHQDHDKHANADTHATLSAGHTRDLVVGVVRRLKDARAAGWDAMQPVLDAAFAICRGREGQPAGAGQDYALPDISPPTPE